MKYYTLFSPHETREEVVKYLPEGETFSDILLDEETREQFQAKIQVSRTPREGWDGLHIQLKSNYLDEEWYVNIVEREEEEEEVTYFESKRLGARRGHMLRSMMAEAEEEEAEKKRIMEQELKQRLQWKKQLLKKILEEDEKKQDKTK